MIEKIENSKNCENNMQNVWGSAEVKIFNLCTVLSLSFPGLSGACVWSMYL